MPVAAFAAFSHFLVLSLCVRLYMYMCQCTRAIAVAVFAALQPGFVSSLCAWSTSCVGNPIVLLTALLQACSVVSQVI